MREGKTEENTNHQQLHLATSSKIPFLVGIQVVKARGGRALPEGWTPNAPAVSLGEFLHPSLGLALCKMVTACLGGWREG